MATPAAPLPVDVTVFVKNLPPTVTDNKINEMFAAIGPVASFKIARDRQTRAPLGHAYVNFYRPEDATKAREQLNYNPIDGRTIFVMKCRRDPLLRKTQKGNIFIRNLDKSIDSKALHMSFAIFGEIISAKVATHPDGTSKGYGFVHFENEADASKAIEQTNGKLIGDSSVPISVTEYKRREERPQHSSDFTTLYVRELPANATDASLQALFGQHGVVRNVFVAQHKFKRATDTSDAARLWASVTFASHDEAKQAIDALNGFEWDGTVSASTDSAVSAIAPVPTSKLLVVRKQTREERMREFKKRTTAFPSNTNLYVKHLTDSVDEKRLIDEFKEHGSIVSAKIARDPATGVHRGCGFVSFSKAEEATRAVTLMNGKMVDGKPLYVTIFKPRAQLAQEAALRQQRFFMQPGGFYPGGEFPQPMYPPYFPGAGFPQQQPFFPQFPGQPKHGGPVAGFPTGPGARGGYPRAPMVRGPGPQPGPYGGYMPYPQQQQQQMPHQGGPRAPRQPHQQQPGPRQQQQQPGPRQQIHAPRPDVVYSSEGHAVPTVLGAAPHPQTVVPQAVAARPAAAAAPATPAAPVNEQAAFLLQLNAAADDQKKELIGERLYPLIEAQEPDYAGKITGMLLEMDNGELIHLLESPEALFTKVVEAKEVLRSSGGDQ